MLESIMKIINNKDKYLDAKKLVDDDMVNITKTSSFWKNDIVIGGQICDENHMYEASLTVSNSTIAAYGCNCPEFKVGKLFCKHTAALAIKYSDEKKNSDVVVYTSTETRKTVNAYLNRSIVKHGENAVNDVKLAYETKLGICYMEVSFFISKGDKNYKIKNLYEFLKLFEEKEYYEYGKNLGIYHTIDSFNEESAAMLEFLINMLRMDRYLCVISGNTESLVKDKSKLILVGEGIDRFINILANGDNKFICNHKEYKISNGNPEVDVKIEEIGNSGYDLTIENIAGYIKGNDVMYLFGKKHIYKTDIDFTEKLRPFFENVFEAEGNKLSINKNDMSSFCNGVIPVLLEYCIVDMPENLMKTYEPWELVCDFNIYSKNDSIYMGIKSEYNGEYFDLSRGICKNRNVCRDYNKEYSIKNVISKYPFEMVTRGELKLEEYEHIYKFLSSGVKDLGQLGNVYISEDLKKLKLVEKMKIGAKVVVDNNWLKLKIDAGDYKKTELEQLLRSYREKKKYVKLNNNTIVKLDNNGLELLAGMAYDLDFSADDLINDNIFIPRYRALYVDSRLSGNVSEYSKSQDFKNLVRTIKQVEDSEIVVPESLNDILRGYQKHGYRWLKTMDLCGFGGILADDMGLGKTIQILTLLVDEYLVNFSDKKTLIVTPTSLIYNWENEIERFAKGLKTVAVIGAKSERVNIINNSEANIFITSYELLKRDINEYKDINFRFQILDEAQNIKNFTTNNARVVKKIQAETKFALTGTPIENRLSELWSIFDFVMPGFLYSNKKFREKFEIPIVKQNETDAMKGLKRMISPFILRRDKREVLKELPDKLEYNLFAKMEGEQQKIYTANALKLRDEILNKEIGDFNSNKIRFLAELTKLRQICCDPSLCYDNYDDDSSKLELCVDLVKTSIEGGHKILLFSQFTSMLDIIAKRLTKEGVSYYTMTGATSKEDRMNLVNKFNKDETSVFLISLKVGGTGLNLTGADIVIHYDPWWNVAVQNQATDRAHRIGQEKVVSVFKLIAKNSVEENILSLQQSKERLSSNIVSLENISLSNLSKNELLSILNIV